MKQHCFTYQQQIARQCLQFSRFYLFLLVWWFLKGLIMPIAMILLLLVYKTVKLSVKSYKIAFHFKWILKIVYFPNLVSRRVSNILCVQYQTEMNLIVGFKFRLLAATFFRWRYKVNSNWMVFFRLTWCPILMYLMYSMDCKMTAFWQGI